MLTRVLALFATLLLASCIDGREEYWFHRDESGRVEIEYTVPAMAVRFNGGADALRDTIRGWLNQDGITLETLETQPVGTDRVRVWVAFRYASRAALLQRIEGQELGQLPSAAVNFAGAITTRWRGMSIEVKRSVNPGAGIPALRFSTPQQLEGHKLDYIVHFDDAPRDSNATLTYDDGKTLVWSYPLATAMNGPLEMRADLPLPVPGWVWLLIVTGIVAAVILVIHRLRKKTARHNPSAPHVA